jgi:hypothetical protein
MKPPVSDENALARMDRQIADLREALKAPKKFAAVDNMAIREQLCRLLLRRDAAVIATMATDFENRRLPLTAVKPAAAGQAIPPTPAKREADQMPSTSNLTTIAALVEADRKRCAAILCSGEAKGREQLAKQLAFATDLTSEQAIAAMAVAPRAAGPAVPPAAVPRRLGPAISTPAEKPIELPAVTWSEIAADLNAQMADEHPNFRAPTVH